MKNFLLKENKLFPIMAYGIVFLYIFCISYFILWNQKTTYCFYVFNIITLIFCICGIIIENNIKRKYINEPKQKEFKITDTILFGKISLVFYAILMGYEIIFNKVTLSPFLYLPILIFTLILLKSILKEKNKSIQINYNKNCIYFDKESILFDDIKEYSVEIQNIICKCTIYLKDDRKINYYEIINLNDFKSSLIKNLRYLKIPEKYID